jgi:D-alanyl-D-alanine carboxypeptidase/D-alanyl-D-alanine-endopeptidase (penicillin-binding protein 4)
VNKFSNNYMAEQVLKTLSEPGQPATFDSALERVRTWLRARGIGTKGLRLGNGSGLYDTNRITPRQLTRLLASVGRDFQIASDFMASLSIMGADGSARSRLRETMARRWVRAKTGTLDGVSALSGYVSAPGRDPIVFSMVFNDLGRGDTSLARGVQDVIAELLARYAAGKPLVDPVEAGVEGAG